MKLSTGRTSLSRLYYMPIHAYEGLDGSGKSYLLAQDAQRWLKHSSSRKVWTLNIRIKGCNELENFHQALFLKKSVIVIDEIQGLFPANNRRIDAVTKNIVSTHRHNGNVILWASQAWEFVHSYWRYATRDVWQCEALHADRLTGVSRWFGTPIQRHVAELITSPERERGISRPRILASRRFFIKKQGMALYDTYQKVEQYDFTQIQDLIDEVGVEEYIKTIKNPYDA